MLRFIVLLALGSLTVLDLALLPFSPGRHAPPPVTASAHRSEAGERQLVHLAATDRHLSAEDLAPAAPSTPQTQGAVPAPAPVQPPSIQDIITTAFSPLGDASVTWALKIAMCESTDNPKAVNSASDAQGLFQFLPSTWRGTPYASQSPFDPAANAHAAAWLLQTYGPSQWECQA